MSEVIGMLNAFRWQELGLSVEGEKAPTKINVEPDGSMGEWFIISNKLAKDGRKVIYFGTFGGEYSIFEPQFTDAELFDMTDPDDREEYIWSCRDLSNSPYYCEEVEVEEEEEIPTEEMDQEYDEEDYFLSYLDVEREDELPF